MCRYISGNYSFIFRCGNRKRIAPPLGTAIGAVAGVVADYAFNLDIIDINNDGKKDSLVDGAKMALDGACDFVGNLLEGVF